MDAGEDGNYVAEVYWQGGKGKKTPSIYCYCCCNSIRALKVCKKHNQDIAIDFMDDVIKKIPFRIKLIKTNNGHEFQAKFHWYCMDKGIEHVYIKPGSPRLNGNVERSHRNEKQEFYQLLEYTDGINLKEKIKEWESFYNFNRPHKGHGGLTPQEMFRAKMNIDIQSQPNSEVL